jgi:hypothetical protein
MATRTQNVDPFIYLAKLNMKCADRTIFLNRDEGFIVQGVGLDSHGDLGPNGSRGTLKSLARSSGKGIFAHAHTPGIYQGGYQVGTNSIIAMPYAHGSTSWMHTDCILYKNGKRTLLHIVDARWRA